MVFSNFIELFTKAVGFLIILSRIPRRHFFPPIQLLTPFLFIGLNQSAIAAPLTKLMSAELISCEEALALHDHTISNSSQNVVGAAFELGTLLRIAGISDDTSLLLTDTLDKLVGESKAIPGLSEHPTINALNQIVDQLIMPNLKPDRTHEAILICMGSKGCKLNDGSPLLGPASPSYSTLAIPLNTQGPIHFELSKGRGNSPVDSSLARELIAMKAGLPSLGPIFLIPLEIKGFEGSQLDLFEGPEGLTGYAQVSRMGVVHISQWIGRLFRDMNKVATYVLVERWIQANLKRIAKGEAPDSAFTKNVWQTSNRQIAVDSNYLVALTFSLGCLRWSEAEAEVFQKYLNGSQVEELIRTQLEGHQRGAHKELVAIVGEDGARRLGIPEQEEFFVWGLNEGASLARTIFASGN